MKNLSRSELVLIGFLAFSFVPIWRSGLKTGLNLWEFLVNHTIWGDAVEYIPEEDYTSISARTEENQGNPVIGVF